MFSSAVWTLILTAPIHCTGSKLVYILGGLRMSTFSSNFHFWVNYSLMAVLLPCTILFMAFENQGISFMFAAVKFVLLLQSEVK